MTADAATQPPAMTEPDAPSSLDRLFAGWRAYVLVGLIALCAALPGVFALPVMDRDEARFTQATRQMLETGDFVRIRVQDVPRNKKPIGIHWLQAGAVAATEPLTHNFNTIWAYRLPSVIGAVLAALAALWAGLALLERRAAILGAALFAASIALGVEGMIAKTDGFLCGITTLVMACLARLYAGKGSKATALLFWIALGIGVLIKGPVTPMVAGLTLAALALWERRWDWMKPLVHPVGVILSVLIVAPWMIAIGIATHGQFFVDAVGGDLAPKVAGGQEGHFAWPGTHLVLLPFLIFPATFALPGAVRLAARAFKTPRIEANSIRFLLAWAIPTFLVFELLPTKLPHYTLPTYPAIALIGGAALLATARERWRWTSALGIVLFALAGALYIAINAYGATFMPGDHAAAMRRATQAGVIGAALFGIALAAFIFTRSAFARVLISVAAALVMSWSIRDRILPEARTLLVSQEIVSALHRADLEPNDQRALWVFGYRETSLVFMTRSDIHLPGDFDLSGVRPGDALVLKRRFVERARQQLLARDLDFKPSAENVRGRNYGNGENVDMVLGEITGANMLAPH